MSAESFKDNGNKFQQAGSFDLAIEMYTKAIEIDSSNHVYFSNRSASYLSKGDPASARMALQDAERCVELNAQWPKGYSRKGAALHRLQQYDQAMEVYNLGLSICPGDAGLVSGLEEVRKVRGSQRNQSMNNLLPMMINRLAVNPKYAPKLADPAFMAKLRMLSNPETMSSIASDPEMLEILSVALGIGSMSAGGSQGPSGGKAMAQDDNDDDEDEEEVYHHHRQQQQVPVTQQARQPITESEPVRLKNLGNSEYKLKHFSEAILHYESAVATAGVPIEVAVTCKYNIAACRLESKEFEPALTAINDAIDYAKTHRAPFALTGKCYHRQGRIYKAMGDFASAIESLKKSLLEDNNKDCERELRCLELEYRQAEAKSYEDVGKSDEAKERGNSAFRSQDFDTAVSEYEEAIKRNPRNPSLFNNLAAVHLKRLDLNSANSAVDRALALDSRYVKAWSKKGEVEFLMKEYHKALKSYSTGLAIDEHDEACRSGYAKTMAHVNSTGGEYDEERARHAMADPEIQCILQDPIIQQVLRDFQERPASAQAAVNRDANLASKIEKLITSGAVQFNKK